MACAVLVYLEATDVSNWKTRWFQPMLRLKLSQVSSMGLLAEQKGL